MKKKVVVFVFIAVAVILSGAYMLFNSVFPVANSADYPNEKDINSFSALYDNETIELSDMSFGSIIVYIKTAQPTRRLSLDDTPDARAYYEITVETEAKQYKYFIYEEYGKVYLEMPYTGIYVIDEDVLDFLQ